MELLKVWIILCTIIFIPLYIIVIKKCVKLIKKLIKEYKQGDELQKIIYKFIVFIFAIPILIYIFDRYDWFNLFRITENLTINYDWLSFLGTYLGTIISAMFLIIITRIDRNANTDSIREAQRPNLCTRVYLPYNFRMTDASVEGYIYNDNEVKNTIDKYVIRITNSGQTVAVIDTEKSYFIVQKYNKKNNEQTKENDEEIEDNKILFNKYEDRLHINSNSEVNIVILEKNIKNIKEVYIEYLDLFNKKYKDVIEIEDGKSIVVYNNNKITD